MTKMMNIREFMDEGDRQRKEFERKALAGKARWSGWRYVPSNLTLQFEPETVGVHPNLRYEVDLERCDDAFEIMDWIIQVSQKDWMPEEQIGYLVKALDELADGLQGALRREGFDFGQHLKELGKDTGGNG